MRLRYRLHADLIIFLISASELIANFTVNLCFVNSKLIFHSKRSNIEFKGTKWKEKTGLLFRSKLHELVATSITSRAGYERASERFSNQSQHCCPVSGRKPARKYRRRNRGHLSVSVQWITRNVTYFSSYGNSTTPYIPHVFSLCFPGKQNAR